VGSLLLYCSVKGFRFVIFFLPTNSFQILNGIDRRKVGNTHKVYARRLRHLGDVHRAEFAGADHAYAKRIVLALLKLGVEIHKGVRANLRKRKGVETYNK